MKLEKIVPRNENFADWYTSVILAAKLIDYTSIKGTMIFQPNGWKIWQNIVCELDRRLARIGVQNVQLPLFIKSSDFNKEKQHVEGFAPEVFLVTKQGDKVLEEPYIIRPTSEIAFCNYYKKIVNSYNELPIKYNQWCNVFRVEKNTRPFLRNSEFFWQELHTVHVSKEEALNNTKKIIKLYENFVNYYLCIPTIVGEKTEGERFAGAENTFTIEALMQDGQALQCATSHYLGQNFAKSFDIKFQNAQNLYEYVYQSSAGLSTRIIGALIMTHADDKGLVLPIKIAPIQIAILSIFAYKEPKVQTIVNDLYKKLCKKKYRVIIDDSDESFGYKIANQEINGTPITLVVGPKDVQSEQITLIRRDRGDKQSINIKDAIETIKKQIHDYQIAIDEKAKRHLESSIVEVNDLNSFKEAINNHKLVLAPWGGSINDEKLLKEQTGASCRCIQKLAINQTCFFTKNKAKYIVYFARAY